MSKWALDEEPTLAFSDVSQASVDPIHKRLNLQCGGRDRYSQKLSISR